MKEDHTKTTLECPNGHRVRGKINLLGSRVRCPKCRIAFIFGPVQEKRSPDHAVSDTSVMRILGDASKVGIPVVSARGKDVNSSKAFRTCTRCGATTSVKLAICSHCNCYLGSEVADPKAV